MTFCGWPTCSKPSVVIFFLPHDRGSLLVGWDAYLKLRQVRHHTLALFNRL